MGNNTDYTVPELLGMLMGDESVNPDPNVRQGLMIGLLITLAQM